MNSSAGRCARRVVERKLGVEPRRMIALVEGEAGLPPGSRERFDGYGLMGQPFASGHVLAFRRFPASSLGPGYTSLWHRSPAGDWTFYADVPPRQACARYFGEAARAAIRTPIHMEWLSHRILDVVAPEIGLEWRIGLGSTRATRLLNVLGGLLPGPAWRSPVVSRLMGAVAGRTLDLGNVRLTGRVPNGQRFLAAPRHIWLVATSRAELHGQPLGEPAPLAPQARLGDFWLPQRGMLAIGQAYFERFDRVRHSARTCRADGIRTAGAAQETAAAGRARGR